MMDLCKCKTCGFVQYIMPPVEDGICAHCGNETAFEQLSPESALQFRKHQKDMSYGSINGNCKTDGHGFRPAGG